MCDTATRTAKFIVLFLVSPLSFKVERFLMEHIEAKVGLDSELHFEFM